MTYYARKSARHSQSLPDLAWLGAVLLITLVVM